ncbi:MAG: phosphoenolpyruvate--protein phosphotransferase [Formivibrio sp.]|nr:phosphoenolpyruvate--protein phosphotransferase [Formivibrio sp.]
MSAPLLPIVKLAASPANKEAAIRLAGQLLLEAGCIEAAYLDSFFAREAMADTYLGSGVAIPHGTVQDRALVRKTGVAVLQVPDGLTWNAGQTVRLVVAIAAQSDEHIDLLRRLTRLMRDEVRLAALCTTGNAADIVAALTDQTASVPQPAMSSDQTADAANSFTLVIDYPSGLHARPAASWVTTAKRFKSTILIRNAEEAADAKSLVGLLSLGIKAGHTIRVTAEGEDAAVALEAIKKTIVELHAEEVAQAQAQAQLASRKTGTGWVPQQACDAIRGVAASPGLTIGVTRQHVAQALIVADTPLGVEADGVLLDAALLAVKSELEALAASTAKRLGEAQAAIFHAQTELLTDPALLRKAITSIFGGHGAAWSWQQAYGAQAEQLAAHPDPLLAARAADLRDIGQRVLRQMLGVDASSEAFAQGTILLAEDLLPSDTVGLDPRQVVGLATAVGGPTSHTAILARTLGMPALVAGGPALKEIPDGTLVILDGHAGCLYLNPSEADLQSAQAAAERESQKREEAAAVRDLPAVTVDGFSVEIAANITSSQQAIAALEAGAEGVGLMRTEFLFMDRQTPPDEEEQYQTYRTLVGILAGRPLIIRTLDIGGDKDVPYLNLSKEDNPFLGVRGLRLLLRRPELLHTQLRALYRAAQHGPLSIIFPMVTDVAEVIRVREIAEAVRLEVGAPVVPLGIMVEVPSVAVMAEAFAPHVDFFSIGTNDLTQYTLAVDRQHAELAPMANSLHPAVLQLIASTVKGAKKHGTWVGVCGGLAGDPLGAAILTGLGVNELSMTASDVPGVKATLRGGSYAQMQVLAQQALACSSINEVKALGSAA